LLALSEAEGYLVSCNFIRISESLFSLYKKGVEMAEKDQEKGKFVGEITHYFPKAGAAVIKLEKPLKVGDKVKIVGGKAGEFEQAVSSIQIDRQPIEEGKAGDEVGVAVDQPVKEGYKVYTAE